MAPGEAALNVAFVALHLSGASPATLDDKAAVRLGKEVVVVEGGVLRMGTDENVRASFRAHAEGALAKELQLGIHGMATARMALDDDTIQTVQIRMRGHEREFVYEGTIVLQSDDHAKQLERQFTETRAELEASPKFSKEVLRKLLYRRDGRQFTFRLTVEGDQALQDGELRQLLFYFHKAESGG